MPSVPVHHSPSKFEKSAVARASGITRPVSPHAHLATSCRYVSGGLHSAMYCVMRMPPMDVAMPER